jgi:hypothetical protein
VIQSHNETIFDVTLPSGVEFDGRHLSDPSHEKVVQGLRRRLVARGRLR